MSPANTLVVAIAAAVGLYAAYRLVMWLPDRVIDTLTDMTRYED
jgi:hypothetical protein